MGNIIFHTQGQSRKMEKYFIIYNITMRILTLAEMNNFSIHLFPHRTRVFHLFEKMGGPSPSEVDIKAFISAPIYCLQSKKLSFINAKILNTSLVEEKNEKTKA